MPTSPIQSPASYVPSRAAAFADADGSALVVSTNNPLPVALAAPAASAALAGSTAATGTIGPFAPATGRPVVLTLAGTWSGTVSVLRSVDGGVSKHPLTVGGLVWARYTANCCEQIWEESEAAVQLYLDIALASGTLAYRIAQ